MKKIICLLLMISMVISLCGCLPSNPEPAPTQPVIFDPNPTQPSETNPVETEPTVPVDTTPTDPNEDTTLDLEIDPNADKTTLTSFIVDMAYEATRQNTMFSPLSFDMAIGMVAQGADSEYESVMSKLLGRDDYAKFASEYMEYLPSLNEEADSNYTKYKNVFEIANTIIASDQYDILDSFIEKIKSFDAEHESVSFENITSVVEKVNAWCKEKTHDMIQEVVKETDFNPDTIAVVLNAIYFESPWEEPWDVVKEGDKSFKTFDGVSSDVKMIRTTTDTYYENDVAIAFGCDYFNGMKFIGILPKEIGEFAVGNLDIDSLLESKTTKYDVRAQMPTFKFDNKIENFVDMLTKAGYGILFDDDVGMFGQMLDKDGKSINMAISKIIQVDAIELDENGTKAAAVTAVLMDNCASVLTPKEVKTVTLDRPFAFIIYDEAMEQIVFVGKVVEP